MPAVRRNAARGRDPRVDDYLARSAAFAVPLLSQLREIVHAACPEVDETIRWSMPFFDHRGRPLCHMAAFRAHCAFGFWRARELDGLPKATGEDGMGQLGRLVTVDDLPPRDALVRSIEAAMILADSETKPVRTAAAPKTPIAMPDDLAAALAGHPGAAERFAAFSPSARREYLAWIVEAKRVDTRASRIANTVAWSAEGRTRNWKHET